MDILQLNKIIAKSKQRCETVLFILAGGGGVASVLWPMKNSHFLNPP